MVELGAKELRVEPWGHRGVQERLGATGDGVHLDSMNTGLCLGWSTAGEGSGGLGMSWRKREGQAEEGQGSQYP